MEIQIADNRPALTVAIQLAKQEGDPRLPQWEAEMARMVTEVTRKFFGALTAETVRKGLAATVGILDLGLFHATSGAIAPETWLLRLRAAGIKGVSKLGVDLVKECGALPESEVVFGGFEGLGTPARELLLLSAREGYPSLMAKMAARRANQRAIRLAQWMIQHSAVGRIVHKNPEETVGECAMADDVFFYVLARECAIPAEKMPQNDDRVIRLTAGLRRSARARYDAFVAKIPQDLKPALFYERESWFDRTVRLSGGKKTTVAG